MTELVKKISRWVSTKRWLPYRFRKSVVKRLDPEMLKDYPFTSDLMGLKYKGNAGNYIERMIYFCGAYEKYMLNFLKHIVSKLKKDNLVFVDVGANVGNHSLFMSQYVKEVHAFEPYEVVRKSFEDNIKLNGIKNIKIHPVGVGDENAKIPFYAPTDFNEGAGSFVEDTRDENKLYSELEVVKGDEAFEKYGINKVDFLKVDVEGFEKKVFDGLKNNMRKNRPIVVFELLKATRDAFGGFEGMKKTFPEDYDFLRFSKASRDGGSYKTAPFDYDAVYKRKDVIACPIEKMGYIG